MQRKSTHNDGGTPSRDEELLSFERAICNVVADLPVATVRRKRSLLRIVPTGAGMPIVVEAVSDKNYLLSIGGWCDYFPRTEPMLRLAVLALHGKLRVVDSYRGGKIWRHEVEILSSEGVWCGLAQVTWVRFAFFTRITGTTATNYPFVEKRLDHYIENVIGAQYV